MMNSTKPQSLSNQIASDLAKLNQVDETDDQSVAFDTCFSRSTKRAFDLDHKCSPLGSPEDRAAKRFKRLETELRICSLKLNHMGDLLKDDLSEMSNTVPHGIGMSRIAEDAKVSETTKSLRDAASTFQRITEKVGNEISDFVDLLGKPSTMIRVLTYLSTTIGQLTCTGRHGLIFIVLEFVKLLTWFVPDSLHMRLMTIGQDTVADIKSYFSAPEKSNKGTSVAPHGAADFLTGLVHKVASVMLGTTKEEVRKKGGLVSLGLAGRSLFGINSGIKTVVEWFKLLIEGLVKIFNRFLSCWFVSKDAEAQTFMQEVTELLGTPSETAATRTFAVKFMDLRSQALRLKDKMEQQKLDLPRFGISMLAKNIDIVLKYYTANATNIELAVRGRESRPTPCFIQFAGLPGKGKSTVLAPLARVMTHPSNCPKTYDRENLIFPVSDTKYMDGYTYQPVWLHDDQWAVATAVDGHDEYKTLLTWISNVPLTVDMAAIERKGAPFVCDLYLGSTNVPFPKPNHMADPKALWRRRQKLFFVTSTNWHNPESFANSDVTDKVFKTTNHLFFKDINPLDDSVSMQNEIRSADEQLARGIKPAGWLSYREMCIESVKAFNKHLETADPEWLFTERIPDELCNLIIPHGNTVTDKNERSGLKLWRKFKETHGAQVESTESDETIAKTIDNFEEKDDDVMDDDMITALDDDLRQDGDGAQCKDEDSGDEIINEGKPKNNDSVMSKIFGFIKSHWKVIIVVLGTSALLWGILRYFSHMVSEWCPDPQRDGWDPNLTIGGSKWTVPDSHKEAYENAVKALHASWQLEQAENTIGHLKYDGGRVSRIGAKTAVITHMSNTVDERSAVILKNQVNLSTDIYAIDGLGIKGRKLLVNRHFWQRLVPQGGFYQVTIKRGTMEPRTVYITEKDVTIYPKKDIVVVTLPSSENAFRDITNLFIDGKSVREGHGECTLMVNNNGQRTSIITNYRKHTEEAVYDDVVQLQSIEYYLGHNNMRGHCMTPVVDNHGGVIIGLHFGGTMDSDERLGLAIPVTKELIQSWVADADIVDHTETLVQPHLSYRDCKLQASGTTELVGTAGKEIAQARLTKSKIVPSLVNELPWQSHAPAALTNRDPRVKEEFRGPEFDPLQVGLDKFGKLCAPYHPDFYIAPRQAIVGKIKMWKGLEKRVLTEFEMLNGLPDRKLKRLDLNTSCGLPWKNAVSQNPKGKHAFIYDINENDASLEVVLAIRDDHNGLNLQRRMREVDGMIRRGEVPLYFIYENVKDELRKWDKIIVGKTRTFDCLPLDILLLTRKYFGMFVAAAHRNCVKSVISVGINAVGTDWTSLARRVGRFGPRIIAGDFKEWDGTVLAEEMMEACEIINTVMQGTEEENTARRTLMYTFIHSYVVALDTVIRKHQGMPSGVALTAVLNSLVNWLRQLATVSEIIYDHTLQLPTADFLLTHFEIATYGDDHILAVSNEIGSIVTFKTMKQTFLSHGFGYTDAEKKGIDYEFQDLKEITYLKRKFVNFNAWHFIGPLDLSSVTKTMVWQHKNPLLHGYEMLAQMKLSFRDELALHGRSVYDDHVAIYNEEVERVLNWIRNPTNSVPFILEDYSTMRSRIDDLFDIGVNRCLNVGKSLAIMQQPFGFSEF